MASSQASADIRSGYEVSHCFIRLSKVLDYAIFYDILCLSKLKVGIIAENEA